jgi:hypothetical protein
LLTRTTGISLHEATASDLFGFVQYVSLTCLVQLVVGRQHRGRAVGLRREMLLTTRICAKKTEGEHFEKNAKNHNKMSATMLYFYNRDHGIYTLYMPFPPSTWLSFPGEITSSIT